MKNKNVLQHTLDVTQLSNVILLITYVCVCVRACVCVCISHAFTRGCESA